MSFKLQRGGALISTLFILLALLIIGASAAYTALGAQRAARAERDHTIALQAAEAALVDAERDIEGGSDPASARAALFADGNADGHADGFVAGCGSAAETNAGLCAHQLAPAAPAWQTIDLAAQGDDARTSAYGRFTGALFPAGAGTLPAHPPRYLIELMPHSRAGEDASRRSASVYRITAIGFGAREHTHVVLQSFYLKAAP